MASDKPVMVSISREAARLIMGALRDGDLPENYYSTGVQRCFESLTAALRVADAAHAQQESEAKARAEVEERRKLGEEWQQSPCSQCGGGGGGTDDEEDMVESCQWCQGTGYEPNPQGTFKCPICTFDKPHQHKTSFLTLRRRYEALRKEALAFAALARNLEPAQEGD